MKKIIILIAILCGFGFCDTIINVYNRVNGTLVKNYSCKSKMIIDFMDDMYYKDIKEMNFEIMRDHIKKIPVHLVITCGKKTLGYYDYSMFSYSIENIEQSLR